MNRKIKRKNIGPVSDHCKSKIFLGIKLKCEHFKNNFEKAFEVVVDCASSQISYGIRKSRLLWVCF